MIKNYNGHSKDGGVYQIRNLVNGKVYIGSTKVFRRRASQHHTSLKTGRHRNKHLLGSWNKYGEQNFIFEVLIPVHGNESQIREAEQKVLEKLFAEGAWNNCYNHKINTNIKHKNNCEQRRGKSYCDIFGDKSEEIRQKQSSSQKARWTDEQRSKYSEKFKGESNPFFGRKHSEGSRKKISEFQVGKTLSKEHLQILKENNRKRMNDPNHRTRLGKMIKGRTLDEIYGKIKADEIRKKRSAGIGKTYSGFLLKSPDGVMYSSIHNMKLFCFEHGLHSSSLRKLLTGVLKTHKGWSCPHPFKLPLSVREI